MARSTPTTPDQKFQDDQSPSELAAAIQAIYLMISEIRDRLAGAWKSHLTVEEISVIVGRAPYTIRQWVREGRLRAERVAGTGPKGRLLIPQSELQRLIKSGRGDGISSAMCQPVEQRENRDPVS